MIRISNFTSTAWGCWRCGRTFSGDAPYGIQTVSDPGVMPAIIFAPVCRDCIENHEYQRDLFIWSRLREGDPVYWRFRLALAWKILRGKCGYREERAA